MGGGKGREHIGSKEFLRFACFFLEFAEDASAHAEDVSATTVLHQYC